MKNAKLIKSSANEDGTFFCGMVPDTAFIQNGYLFFDDNNETYIVLQKRDNDGNILSEKEIDLKDIL